MNKKRREIIILFILTIVIFFAILLIIYETKISGKTVSTSEIDNEWKHYELKFNSGDNEKIAISVYNNYPYENPGISYFTLKNLKTKDGTPVLSIPEFDNIKKSVINNEIVIEDYNWYNIQRWFYHSYSYPLLDYYVGPGISDSHPTQAILDKPYSDGVRILTEKSNYFPLVLSSKINCEKNTDYTIEFDAKTIFGGFIFKANTDFNRINLASVESTFINYDNSQICDIFEGNCIETNIDNSHGIFWFNFYDTYSKEFFSVNNLYSYSFICESNDKLCKKTDKFVNTSFSNSLFLIDYCTNDLNKLCLIIDNGQIASEIIISETSGKVCSDKSIGRNIEAIGNFFGDSNSEIAVEYCEYNNLSSRKNAVAIIDISSKKVVAKTYGPIIEEGASRWGHIGYLSGPNNKEYPFLVPASDGDSTTALGNGVFGKVLWGYICLFKPGTKNNGRCGPNFMEINLTQGLRDDGTLTPYGFKEIGTYLYDFNNDGWEDINLIYHRKQIIISGFDGKVLNKLEYDIEKISDNTNSDSSSGRNYGTHSIYKTDSGKIRDVFVAGSPVGGEGNAVYYVGVIESDDNLSSRRVKWAKFFSYENTKFQEINRLYENNPPVERIGNFTNGQIHRFSDSRIKLNNTDAIIFSRFLLREENFNACLIEQYKLYTRRGEPGCRAVLDCPDYYPEWSVCKNKALILSGDWTIHSLNESDGTELAILNNSYLWGYSNKILPDQKTGFIIQEFDKGVPFSMSQDFLNIYGITYPDIKLGVYIYDNDFIKIGEIPVNEMPRIIAIPQYDNIASGSSFPSYIAEFVIKDIDNDGLGDIQFANGEWVGYSVPDEKFIVKSIALSENDSLPFNIKLIEGRKKVINVNRKDYEILGKKINIAGKRALIDIKNPTNDKNVTFWLSKEGCREINQNIAPINIKLIGIERDIFFRKILIIKIDKLVIPDTCNNGFCQREETKNNCEADCKCHTDKRVGDLNQDGYVDALDASIIGLLIEGKATIIGYPCGDTNNDQQFNALDIQQLSQCVFSTCRYWPMR